MATDPLEGKTGTDKRTGQRVVRQGGAWVPLGKAQPMEASMRARTDIGLAPMIKAQSDMADVEGKSNPFGMKDNPDNAAAEVMTGIGLEIPSWGIDFHPLEGVAKKLGGEDFQKYQQSRKAFEAQLMPIMSGAAVSPSEAARQIKAALPELGDDPQILKEKARTRAMMLNGAAKAKGLPIPYPEVPTWGVNTLKTGAATPKVRKYNPQTNQIE